MKKTIAILMFLYLLMGAAMPIALADSVTPRLATVMAGQPFALTFTYKHEGPAISDRTILFAIDCELNISVNVSHEGSFGYMRVVQVTSKSHDLYAGTESADHSDITVIVSGTAPAQAGTFLLTFTPKGKQSIPVEIVTVGSAKEDSEETPDNRFDELVVIEIEAEPERTGANFPYYAVDAYIIYQEDEFIALDLAETIGSVDLRFEGESHELWAYDKETGERQLLGQEAWELNTVKRAMEDTNLDRDIHYCEKTDYLKLLVGIFNGRGQDFDTESIDKSTIKEIEDYFGIDLENIQFADNNVFLDQFIERVLLVQDRIERNVEIVTP